MLTMRGAVQVVVAPDYWVKDHQVRVVQLAEKAVLLRAVQVALAETPGTRPLARLFILAVTAQQMAVAVAAQTTTQYSTTRVVRAVQARYELFGGQIEHSQAQTQVTYNESVYQTSGWAAV